MSGVLGASTHLTLNDLLRWEDKKIPNPATNRFVLVRDCVQTPGDFIIIHSLVHMLKAGGAVCFVGVLHPLEHYVVIARKMGVNLIAFQQAKKFVFIDCMKKRMHQLQQEQEKQDKQEKEGGEEKVTSTLSSEQESEEAMRSLFLDIQRAIQTCSESMRLPLQVDGENGGVGSVNVATIGLNVPVDASAGVRPTEESKGMAVILDDLSTLAHMHGVRDTLMTQFVTYCKQLCCGSTDALSSLSSPSSSSSFSLSSSGSLVGLLHGDVHGGTYGWMEESMKPHANDHTGGLLSIGPQSGGNGLCGALSHLADTLLTCRALPTGYSTDVDGQIIVVKRKPPVWMASGPPTAGAGHMQEGRGQQQMGGEDSDSSSSNSTSSVKWPGYGGGATTLPKIFHYKCRDSGVNIFPRG
jgi:hypothetical protein